MEKHSRALCDIEAAIVDLQSTERMSWLQGRQSEASQAVCTASWLRCSTVTWRSCKQCLQHGLDPAEWCKHVQS